MAKLHEIPQGYEVRMRIIHAMSVLMERSSYSSLTVAAICEQAAISRQTFYHYFLDKNDAANWYGVQMMGDSLFETGRSLSFHEGEMMMLKDTLSELDYFRKVLKSRKDYNSFARYTTRYLEAELRRTVTDFKKVEMTEQLEFQLTYWCRSNANMTIDWILNGSKMAPEVLARYKESCVPHELYQIIKDPIS
jgi:AcrR family transcriptional regulator